jgi:hypothetical protein
MSQAMNSMTAHAHADDVGWGLRTCERGELRAWLLSPQLARAFAYLHVAAAQTVLDSSLLQQLLQLLLLQLER